MAQSTLNGAEHPGSRRQSLSVADLYMGLGSLVYALAKADGQIEPREIKLIRSLLGEDLYGGVAMCSFTARAYHHDTVEEAYQHALRCFVAHLHGLTPGRLEHFLTILEAVAGIDGAVCEAENTVLNRFRADLRQAACLALEEEQS